MGFIETRFSEILKDHMEKRGEPVTLQTVALETKLAYGTVLKWAKGQVNRYDAETLATFCEYFGVQPGDLLVYKSD